MIVELWDNTAAQIDALIDLALFWVICGVSAACLVRQNSFLDANLRRTRGGTTAVSDRTEFRTEFFVLLLQQLLDELQLPGKTWDEQDKIQEDTLGSDDLQQGSGTLEQHTDTPQRHTLTLPPDWMARGNEVCMLLDVDE